jgi:hypothetical protein
MWHGLSEVTYCGCAMWHGLGEVALSWPATWHFCGAHLSGACAQLGPLADLDQWKSVMWYLTAELAQSVASM